MLSKSEKKRIITKFGQNSHDSGCLEVQIALYLADLKALTRHLQKNPHDLATKRILLQKVAYRKRLTEYLRRTSLDRYTNLVARIKSKS